MPPILPGQPRSCLRTLTRSGQAGHVSIQSSRGCAFGSGGKMNRIAATLVVVATVITMAVAGAVPALASPAGGAGGPTTFYLSLGDSLAQGVQPNSQGV